MTNTPVSRPASDPETAIGNADHRVSRVEDAAGRRAATV
jgi:hypothetical protein